VVGQRPGADREATARENLRLSARLYGMRGPEREARIDELLERFGLTEAADRIVRGFSGGMERRLEIALALVHRPRVLFLDEPTTGLDPVSRKAIWEEVEKLNRDGTTVFLTTQYLEEADQLADRVGIIDDGRIVAEGTPGALKAEIGRPHLEVRLAEGELERAEEVVAGFGRPMPSRDGAVMVELERGAAEVAPVVRALDEAGLAVESLDLVQPTLDDVFVAKTGHHLEGDEEPGDEDAPVLEQPA
jgi:ABC-2 type transport system ATP-binding protein